MARSLGRHRHSLFATVALLIFAVAPLALAQSSAKAKKKGPKPAPSASASASDAAPDEPTPSATPAAAATDTSPPPESAPPDVAPAAGSIPDEQVADDITNTMETPGKSYRFVGARYRGTVIPSFLEHLFVNDGGTVYSNSIGAEVDFRKDQKSTIVWLQYTEYGFDNTLFFQKNQPDEPNNYSVVSSSLKGIYVGLDELWSTPIANHFDFEYGFGLGLGVIFGNLYNDWVYQGTANIPGAIQGSNGNYYVPCNSPTDGPPLSMFGTVSSCSPQAHSNSSVTKVGNYVEPNWFNGGSVPVVFPHIAGQVGIRWKPIKQLQTRLDLGIALTGFWFGLSADYGLEQTHSNDTHPASKPPSKEPGPDSDKDSDKSSREVGQRSTL
jgi:hypothetical protein